MVSNVTVVRGKGTQVAAWRDLVTFIRRVYEVVRFEADEIRIMVRFGDDREDENAREQTIVVAREVFDGGEEWVQLATPFARVDQVDLAAVLDEIGTTTVVGGAVIMGDYVVLRHSLPLENLDFNEFSDPLELLAGAGDQLEREFTGYDDY
jgi:hypothetical protein